MARYVVLLRGINLGARRRVSMAELREVLTSFGHSDVRTHLQSGNLVLASDATPAQLEHRVEEQILKGLDLDVSVLVRTRDELANVIERDPFGEFADDPKHYQVSFLSAEPETAVVRDLGAADFLPERVVVSGREIYAWHPNGIQRSPLAQLLTDRHLGVTATARNWNTVIKLLALADE
jgi:uncharacterized protein (DUF1697 family)